jgi:hypothetical protein
MEQSAEVRTHHLWQISTDLSSRMAEVHKLREMVRLAEAAQRGHEPVHPVAVLQAASHELRV